MTIRYCMKIRRPASGRGHRPVDAVPAPYARVVTRRPQCRHATRRRTAPPGRPRTSTTRRSRQPHVGHSTPAAAAGGGTAAPAASTWWKFISKTLGIGYPPGSMFVIPKRYLVAYPTGYSEVLKCPGRVQKRGCAPGRGHFKTPASADSATRPRPCGQLSEPGSPGLYFRTQTRANYWRPALFKGDRRVSFGPSVHHPGGGRNLPCR